jgi:hypothetical protein
VANFSTDGEGKAAGKLIDAGDVRNIAFAVNNSINRPSRKRKTYSVSTEMGNKFSRFSEDQVRIARHKG